jgi:hypothetical protein
MPRCGNALRIGRVLLPAVLLLAHLGSADAASHRPRFGLQHFGARYTGGYSVVVGTETLAGPADIRIRSARDGRSARVTWTNTFYTPRGSYRIVMRWSFLPDGTFLANTIDPRVSQTSASGAFTLNANRPVLFSAASASGLARASGQLRLIGGGALSITVTLSGLPEGDVTFSFSGGRR